MKAKFMGVQNMDFVAEETGERIVGKKLHLVSVVAENDQFMTGYRVATVFVRDCFHLPDLKPGDTIDLVYTQRLGSNKSFLAEVVPIKG